MGGDGDGGQEDERAADAGGGASSDLTDKSSE
jgi:hypothetical protein